MTETTVIGYLVGGLIAILTLFKLIFTPYTKLTNAIHELTTTTKLINQTLLAQKVVTDNHERRITNVEEKVTKIDFRCAYEHDREIS